MEATHPQRKETATVGIQTIPDVTSMIVHPTVTSPTTIRLRPTAGPQMIPMEEITEAAMVEVAETVGEARAADAAGPAVEAIPIIQTAVAATADDDAVAATTIETIATATTIIALAVAAIANRSNSTTRSWSMVTACWRCIPTDTVSYAVPKTTTAAKNRIRLCPVR